MYIDIILEDIKSHNVLIFKNHDDTYTARVTDFEYSTRYLNEYDLIVMSKSLLWNASEHDRNNKKWTTSEAKKMNFFSVDMLFLWSLFERELSTSTLSCEEYEISCSLFERSIETLQLSKISRKITLLAHSLLEADQNLNKNEKDVLKVFFSSVLDENQVKRDMSAGNLFKGCV
jgi:hypothetical protein